MTLTKIKTALSYVLEKSPFYKNHFSTLELAKITSLEDFKKLPFTTKEDIQQQNQDFYCVSWDEISDIVSTSGTLGSPIFCPLSEKDLNRLGENESQALQLTGITKQDRVVITTTLDRRFMAGLAYFLGLRKIGAAVCRTGPGVPGLQWDSILAIQATVLVAVPSFVLKMIEYANENNIEFEKTNIKKIICIGEPIRNDDFSYNTLGKKITESWKGVQLFSTYASTEMATAFTECPSGNGGHQLENLIHCEIIDENGNEVPDGEVGELIVTTFGVEAMPLIRYKTGDLVKKYTAPCSCGNHSPRIGPVLGRKKQMIKYKGTTIYPMMVMDVLNSLENIKNYIIEIRMDEMQLDELVLRIGLKNDKEDLTTIKAKIQSQLRVLPKLILESPENILKEQFPAGARKPIIIKDLR